VVPDDDVGVAERTSLIAGGPRDIDPVDLTDANEARRIADRLGHFPPCLVFPGSPRAGHAEREMTCGEDVPCERFQALAHQRRSCRARDADEWRTRRWRYHLRFMPNIIGLGVDLTEIDRIANTIDRYGDRFVNRIFTDGEIAYCTARRTPAIHFAARFAA